jgi:hypothetical protein
MQAEETCNNSCFINVITLLYTKYLEQVFSSIKRDLSHVSQFESSVSVDLLTLVHLHPLLWLSKGKMYERMKDLHYYMTRNFFLEVTIQVSEDSFKVV